MSSLRLILLDLNDKLGIKDQGIKVKKKNLNRII